jgi:hypothetical protein
MAWAIGCPTTQENERYFQLTISFLGHDVRTFQVAHELSHPKNFRSLERTSAVNIK